MLAYLLAVAFLGALGGWLVGYHMGREDARKRYEDRIRMIQRAIRR